MGRCCLAGRIGLDGDFERSSSVRSLGYPVLVFTYELSVVHLQLRIYFGFFLFLQDIARFFVAQQPLNLYAACDSPRPIVGSNESVVSVSRYAAYTLAVRLARFRVCTTIVCDLDLREHDVLL